MTQLLAQWSEGNEGALSELTAIVYQELRRLAQQHLRRERPGHTIQRTALVNEAFVRLVSQQSVDWRSRSHFFALASSLMRRILVDYARARTAQKRGGAAGAVPLDAVDVAGDDRAADLLELDQALERLDHFDDRLARLVEYRFFGGLTYDEIAAVTGVSVPTVKRDWTRARTWLFRALGT